MKPPHGLRFLRGVVVSGVGAHGIDLSCRSRGEGRKNTGMACVRSGSVMIAPWIIIAPFWPDAPAASPYYAMSLMDFRLLLQAYRKSRRPFVSTCNASNARLAPTKRITATTGQPHAARTAKPVSTQPSDFPAPPAVAGHQACGDSGAGRCVSSRARSLMSSMVPPKLNSPTSPRAARISSRSVAVAPSSMPPSAAKTTP